MQDSCIASTMSNRKGDLNRALVCQVLNPAYSRLSAAYNYNKRVKYFAIKQFTNCGNNFMTKGEFLRFYRGNKNTNVGKRQEAVMMDFYNKVMAATGGFQQEHQLPGSLSLPLVNRLINYWLNNNQENNCYHKANQHCYHKANKQLLRNFINIQIC
jgi:hypothetical protein